MASFLTMNKELMNQNKNYFRQKTCPNCSSGIIASSKKCGYCGTVQPFRSELPPEIVTEMQEMIQKISKDIQGKFGYYSIYTNVPFRMGVYTSRYPLLFFPIFFLTYYITHNIYLAIGLCLITMPGLFFIAKNYWDKEFYNSDLMNNYIRTKIIPDIDKFLEEKNLEWYDFDEIASRETMESEVGFHSTIANLIYYENK